MSVEALSIGDELKDSYKPTSKWLKETTSWLSDIEEFYRERTALEKDYAAKLADLCKRHFDKKQKVSSVVSVGEDPKITPGSLESASLVLWADLLTNTENIAQERVNLAEELNSRVANGFAATRSKCSRLIKQMDNINDVLVQDKSAFEDDVAKAKRHYDSLCQATELARERAEKLNSEKNLKKLQEKTVDMNNGKNDYLIKINIANRLKDKYYYQDIPELLDYLQRISEIRTALSNRLLHDASAIERTSCDKIKNHLSAIDETIDQNNPCLDTAMYIKHNAQEWQEPQDFYFVPCSMWHDDENLVIKEPELTTLRKRLAQCSTEYPSLEDSCLETKTKLELLDADRNNHNKLTPDLKFDSSLVPALSMLQSFFKSDSQRITKQVEMDVIQNFARDQDLTWVEDKTPRKLRFGFLRRSKAASPVPADGGGGGSDAKLMYTVTSGSVMRHDDGAFNLRRSRTGASRASSHQAAAEPCRVLYPYTAAGSDEISMAVTDSIVVLLPDLGSGWTMVEVNGSASGLVPTLYIQASTGTSTGDEVKKRGPAVAPKRGAKRVQYVTALFDYTADGDDELSISAGDRIVLHQRDTENSGWTEGELNGRRGLFPTSYVE